MRMMTVTVSACVRVICDQVEVETNRISRRSFSFFFFS